jgi:endo-1,4-beta-xylanase
MRYFRLKIVTCLCLLWFTAAQCYGSYTTENLIDPAAWEVSPQGAAVLTKAIGKTVMGQDCPLLKIDIKPGSKIRLSQTIHKGLAAGYTVSFIFTARSQSKGVIRFGYESKTQTHPFAPVTNQLTPDWKACVHYYDINGCKSGDSSVYIEVDKSLEIKDLKVLQVKNQEANIEARTIDRSLVDKRIEFHRKGSFAILVKDSNEKPVPGVHVRVEQVRHRFLFGGDLKDTGEDGHSRKAFADLFNLCSIPLAWNEVEPKRGQSDFYAIDRTVAWCEKNKMMIKLSPLVTDLNYPRWAPEEPEAAMAALRLHIFNCVKHFLGSVKYWDVYVSPLTAREIKKRGYGAVLNQASGDARLILRGLQWGHLADQSRQDVFIYSESDFRQLTYVLSTLSLAKELPDAIGIHFKMGSTDAPEMASQCKEIFGSYRKPIYLTVLNSSDVDSKQVEELYRILFSSPEVQSITWSDSTHSQKVYDELMKLIHHTWWTSMEGVSNDKGLFETKAFFGDYAITVTGPNGKSNKTDFVFSPTPLAPKQLTISVPH